MDKAYIKVKSITHAIKAKDILNSNGFKAQVVRNTNQGRGEGCGYAVIFDGNIMYAEKLLNSFHVKTSGSGEIRDRL